MMMMMTINIKLLMLTICLLGSVHSRKLGKHKASEEAADDPDYTNHVVAYEKGAIGFEKIEEFLQDNVKDEATEPNMVALQQMISEQLTKPAQESDSDLIVALNMFLNLAKLTDESTCNHYGYEFLVGLKNATRYRIDRQTTKRRRLIGPLRRIELLMSRFALMHAQKCKAVYQYHFARLLPSFDRDQLNSIDAFMSEVIRDRVGANSDTDPTSAKAKLKRVYTSFIERNDSFKKSQEAKLIFDFMKSTLSAGPNNTNGEEDRKKLVRDWLERHLLEPCDSYSRTMSADVFEPAQLDARVMEKSDQIKPALDEQREGFIFGWARFGLCCMLQRDRHFIIKNIISLMEADHGDEHENK